MAFRELPKHPPECKRAEIWMALRLDRRADTMCYHSYRHTIITPWTTKRHERSRIAGEW
ncbi:MAG: hypothetical protein J6B33_02375 [Prevotella sp.]|nr:hypothetical protein [Prevotella sp.]